MELRLWIASFKALHDRAKKGNLSPDERKQYLGLRNELATAMCTAQKLTTLPGQTPRQTMRVARALQADLELTEGRQRVTTMTLSVGGFSCLLPKDPGKGPPIGFSMKIPGANDPLLGRVTAVDVQKRQGNVLVSFTFNELGAAEQERLETVLFDSVLQQFEGMQF